MRLAIGSDERTSLTEEVVEYLRSRGHAVEVRGPSTWPEVAREVAEAVASGDCDQGVLFCWTGTGVSIAANKVRGVRAALCTDAETCRGARRWNDANVLCMSLRLISGTVAREILDAWFETPADESERQNIQRVDDLSRWCGRMPAPPATSDQGS